MHITAAVTCPEAPDVAFASRDDDYSRNYKAMVHYKCASGLRMDDGFPTKNITCQKDSRWSEENFTCGGKYTGRSEQDYHYYTIRVQETPFLMHSATSPGYVIRRCHTNCFATRTVVIFCSLLAGSRCQPVPAVTHAFANTSQALPGTVVSYACMEGHRPLNKSAKATVMCDGQDWRGDRPVCRRT